MKDFLSALGLVLVIEGALYALMPETMKRLMSEVQNIPASLLRLAGLGAAVAGVLAVWLVRG